MKYFDNTRIEAYRTCPRKFFFRHEKHWVSEYKSTALINGLAWHDSMDAVWDKAHEDISDIDLLKIGMSAYLDTWISEGMVHPKDMTMEQQELYTPRGPHIATETLMNYIQQRRRFIRDGEVLAIERPFAVPLSENLLNIMYIGRLDKVFKSKTEGTVIIEHKTTTEFYKSSGLKQSFMESFSPNSQVDGYLHTGNILYENLQGLLIDVAVFNKTVHDQFKFIPIRRQFSMLSTWLAETQRWIEDIENDRKTFGETGKLGRAFPKDTSRCSDYGGCPYRDVCKFYPVPEDLINPPPGFTIDPWNPFDILKIEKLGLEPEKISE